ncbi:MAG: SNF2-related protein [Deltaproteobacteria bacterium]|nr:SNF2-related protein [Deltaproteobacteria bacterium]
MSLKKSQVPSFFEALADECAASSSLVDEHLEFLHIIRSFDRIDITPAQLERDWYWLSADYGFGNASIALADILSAKKEGRRYIGTPSGWVDCTAPELDGLNLILDRYQEAASDAEATGRIGLSPMDLLRVSAGMNGAVAISGGTHDRHLLRRLFEFKPAEALPPPEGLKSSLRPYQVLGAEWLRFLFENGFGGVLCDDMGLGKTHEVMAFLLSLREHNGMDAPFLVVCPTTVLSHWDQKVKAHAPGLNPVVYHGGEGKRRFSTISRKKSKTCGRVSSVKTR